MPIGEAQAAAADENIVSIFPTFKIPEHATPVESLELNFNWCNHL